MDALAVQVCENLGVSKAKILKIVAGVTLVLLILLAFIFMGVSAWADDSGASQIIQTFAVVVAGKFSDDSSGETEAEKDEKGNDEEQDEKIMLAIEPPETQ